MSTDQKIIQNEDEKFIEVKIADKPLKVYNGVILPDFDVPTKDYKNLVLRQDDTYIIGYPKSGTTWIEEICWLIQNNLDFERAKNEFHFSRVCIMERFTLSDLDSLPSPRCFKIHLPLQLLPDNIEKKAKIVYVYRDPKDALASYYNFSKNLKRYKFTGTFEDLFEYFMSDKITYSGWINHVNQYLSTEGIFVIKYEEMLKRPFELTKNLVKYLDKDYTDEQINQLVNFCSFNNLKQLKSFDKDSLFKFGMFDNNKTSFFNKGQIGNGSNYFTKEMAQRLDEKLKKEFKYLNQNMDYLSSQSSSVV